MHEYQVWLAETLIGTTRLESADPPMGCVSGRIIPIIKDFGYDYVKQFYASRHIGFDDYPDVQLLATRATAFLKVITPEGKTIESLGNQICGMGNDEFEVCLEGVGYPFYAEEFPKHCAAYERFYADWEKNRYRGTVEIWGKTYFLKKI